MKPCSECGAASSANGMCAKHNTAAWRKADPERAKQSYKAWYDKNAEKERVKARARYRSAKEKRIQQAKDWAAKNRERKRLNNAASVARDPLRVRRVNRTWRHKNRDVLRAYAAIRRAQKLGGGGRHTKEEVNKLVLSQRGKCAVCKSDFLSKYEVDHIVPLVSGGSDDISNIQILCISCNRRKGSKDPIEFMQAQGFLL